MVEQQSPVGNEAERGGDVGSQTGDRVPGEQAGQECCAAQARDQPGQQTARSAGPELLQPGHDWAMGGQQV
jgi:hypothetical protein